MKNEKKNTLLPTTFINRFEIFCDTFKGGEQKLTVINIGLIYSRKNKIK